ncbi:MAG: hypothetical protein GY854_32150 [Deltaproteobacteria bacterium]|nr:hypothetical protein [Deltaproteobacteria bacterium]
MKKPNERIKTIFHRITLTLLGLFEVYGADEELVARTAVELETMIKEHTGIATGTQTDDQGKVAMESLLDALEREDG